MNNFIDLREKILEVLKTDAESGLTGAQAAENAKQYGINEFSRSAPVPLHVRIYRAATEPMMIILLVAGAIALGVNMIRGATGGETDLLECLGIFIAIALCVIITVTMEGKSARAFEALSRMNEDVMVKIIRDKKTQLVRKGDVVAGDIVILGTGDKIPADGRLLESVSLHADESSLTGESDAVEKNAEAVFTDAKTPLAERHNMLYSGCFITDGHGKMVVTEVGDKTEFGKIAGELADVRETVTPLQGKLAKLGKRIALAGSCAAAAVFIIQLVRFIVKGTASLETISDAFITSIVLIVASVPEGLPTIVAISLSISIIKMSRQNALVKRMIACETIGCINVICSDKTGTLTQNRMAVVGIYAGGEVMSPDRVAGDVLVENFCINTTADVSFDEKGKHFIGNPTECALLTALHESNIDYRTRRRAAEIDFVFPFSSETKNMTTISGDVAYTKGSPEKIIALSRLSAAETEEITAKITGFQQKACRVIAFAHKKLDGISDYRSSRNRIECDMEFDGFAAIADPLRSDVYDAVEKCRHAGVDLKILTGDNIVTARAIAGELGVLDDQHVAVEARELEPLSDAELSEALRSIRVIARSTPGIKMRVVNLLKSEGNVVAVTGDGINDAPALKNADVGIAMGITGTEVSKEASDIVLLDDSFATIVRAVQWGRGIYDNFRRFIQFQLTVNVSSVLVVLVSIVVGFEQPFTALQLLWVNIIMDGPPALTLGLEPIRGNLMDRKPTRRDSNIVSGEMLFHIVSGGVFISAVLISQEAWNFLKVDEIQKSSVLFTLFILFQLFNAFNSRELGESSIFSGMAANKLMLAVFAGAFLLQFVITQYCGAFFGTVALPLSVWGKMFVCAFGIIVFSELIKVFRRMKKA